MFTTLKFKMENSIGTPVTVNLYHQDGLVDYEILLPDLGARDAKRCSMGRKGSARFLERLKKSGFIYLIASFESHGAKENEGDFWSLYLELEDGTEIRLKGPDLEESLLYPIIQDFAELLDMQFSMTQFISQGRVDRLDILFIFNELISDESDDFSEFEQLAHSELISLDRSTFTFSYAKRFPAGCFHSKYECKCEHQIRQILDQTTTALKDQRLFEDVVEEDPVHPIILFKFTFHDGSTEKVKRSLSLDCLRDQLYIEMMDVLFETSLNLMYKGGIFDKRFLQDSDEELPFSIVYTEGDEDPLCDDREMA